ncbi:MAG: S23 ribosomal protein [uncultured bacterium]|nr:MAG: S23 ribosomal protein [uncultured bacterium]
MGMVQKIRSFTDLVAWKEAHNLAVSIYKVTDEFPDKEIYSLTDQMRRSATSIGSNIAEGFSRQSRKEKLQFYYTAKGSLTELQNHLLIARDVKYLGKDGFDVLAEQTVQVSKLLNGLIKSIKTSI